ncbi:Ig-like domain-containing protein [Hanstruepera neustonica]|uniref:carbohydrate-binding protein n=1 Tax=Hanstruepera neustonica TaxID=1445657 RepID=UPI001A9C980E|nr:carbohydrate-binding protein [Hanstruepera neustonica]
MKNIKYNYFKNTLLLTLVLLVLAGCERDLSDDAVLAGFSKEGAVFTDGPIALGSNFYFPYNGSKPDAVSFDGTETYKGNTSIEISVPNADDPEGNYAGAILRVDGAGRDLTGFDALTFYAKASQGVSLDAIGFGEDFIDNKYQASIVGVSIGTGWNKYVVPIPDPSKLVEERGVFRYAAGTQATNGFGYTIWLDEIRFERLGTVAQPRPAILNGQDIVSETFIGANRPLTGLTQTFNLGNGQDQTVLAAPSYFDFTSSNPGVATVDEFGFVSVVGSGTAMITASINGVDAEGSLTIISLGEFETAPVPDVAPENVISVFSDAYDNVPVDYYNGFFNGDGQTTQGGAPPIDINGDQVINYTDLNFVGIGTFLNVAPVNATEMTHMHVDINVNEALDPGDQLRVQLINGVQTANETSGSVVIPASDLVSNGWGSYDIPLGEFTGLASRSELGLIFFISNNSANVPTISNIYVDNIYYYKEVVDPTPPVDDSAATEVALPVGFQSTSLVYDFEGFEGADSSIEANPMTGGINPTSLVMRSIKTPGAQFFAGTFLNLDSPMDFSTSQKFRMKVLSPKSGIPIRVRLEDQNNTAGIELDASTTTLNEWEELEWDFSGLYNPSVDYVRIVVFFEFVPGLAGDGSTYYYDDLKVID